MNDLLIRRFEEMVHGVQAMRRHVERLACPTQGGVGVRAQLYPHQILNVHRIVTATRIRHLIADEVGMGKTVQALMVVNALRLQRGRLRVRVVVGRAELQAQWGVEVCRAHTVVWTESEAFGDDRFEVLDERDIVSNADTFDPNTFDLLILDEPQSLKVETLRYVAEHAEEFPRLLLLTASPNLRSPERFCELLQMLEPQRVERARREVDRTPHLESEGWSKTRVRDLDELELRLILDRFIAGCAGTDDEGLDPSFPLEGASEHYHTFADYRRIRLLTDARWRYRSVLRSYRQDYPRHLPTRELVCLTAEPTAVEQRRMRLGRSYVRRHYANSPDDAARLLRRIAVGSETLQRAVSAALRVRGDGAEDPDLAGLADLVGRDAADARLDLLVDWLYEFWRLDPKRKVLIAAEDNRTVDELHAELSWRMPEVGPRGGRMPLCIDLARFEKQSPRADDAAATTDAAVLESISTSQLKDFRTGETQLLIAHDQFREAINLQCADAIIFYSLPWKPEQIDQWIGRVDRLGRDFVEPERPSPPKPVKIVTLHRRGDPTEELEALFAEYRIFEAAVDTERGLLAEIEKRIHQEILYQSDSTDSASSAGQPHAKAASKEVCVPSGSLWTTDRAVELFERLRQGEPGEPQLRHTRPIGFVSSASEQCLASWIQLLRQHGAISTRSLSSSAETGGGRRAKFYTMCLRDRSGVVIESLDAKGQSYPAFFIARRNIFSPPRVRVITGERPDGTYWETLLQFLSHGSDLHEDLIDTYRTAGRSIIPLGVQISCLGSQYYPKGTSLTPNTYAVTAGFVDPAARYAREGARDFQILDGEPGEEVGVRLSAVVTRSRRDLEAAIEADIRFVRTLAPARACCVAYSLTAKVRCSAREAADLLTPNWTKECRPSARPLGYTTLQLAALADKLRRVIADDERQAWVAKIQHARERIEERCELIRVEAFDEVWNIDSAIRETYQIIQALTERSPAHAEQTIQLTYRPRLALLQKQRALVEATRDRRVALLQATLKHLISPDVTTVELQAFAVVEIRPDPMQPPEATATTVESDADAEEETRDPELPPATQRAFDFGTPPDDRPFVPPKKPR